MRNVREKKYLLVKDLLYTSLYTRV